MAIIGMIPNTSISSMIVSIANQPRIDQTTNIHPALSPTPALRSGTEDYPGRAPRRAGLTVGGIPGRRPVYRKQRPDIGATVAASLTGELRFEIGQPDMIGPAIGVDHDRMRAFVIGAIDEKPGGGAVKKRDR